MEGEFRKVAARTTDSHQERTLMLVSNEQKRMFCKNGQVLVREKRTFKLLIRH